MKKIKKAEIDFPKKHYPRRKELEALSDKQCEMVRVINWLVEAQVTGGIHGTKDVGEDLKDVRIEKLREKQEELRQIIHNYDLQATEMESILRDAGIPKVVPSTPGSYALTLTERVKILAKTLTKMKAEDLSESKRPKRKLIDTDFLDSKTFRFSKFNLDMLESGRYHVEKNRATLEEIRIGFGLRGEFARFVERTTKEVSGHLISFADGKWTVLGAKTKFAQHGDVYYIKPNEILFLSDYDQFYVRAIKKG